MPPVLWFAIGAVLAWLVFDPEKPDKSGKESGNESLAENGGSGVGNHGGGKSDSAGAGVGEPVKETDISSEK